MKQTVEQVLAAKGIRTGGGGLLFAMTAGSVAFNLSVEGSDRDYFAVYAADVDASFALTRPLATVDSHDPDLQMYEAAKYCELLLKGNPKVVEPLFAEHFTWQSEEWRELKKLRHHLMTRVTVDQYVSYALSQLGDYVKGRGAKPPAKKFYHAFRLMQEARRIITHGAPRVWYEDGDEDRAFLMSIRRGEQDLEALVGQLLELRAEVDVLKLQLPEKTDPRVLGEWLLYLRRTHAAAKRAGAQPTSGAQQEARARALCPAEGSSVPLRDKARDLLRQFGVEGEILCCIPSGSTAHGLGGSSGGVEDYVAVYAAPTDVVVGLTPPPQRVDELGADSKQRETYARGMLVFEAGYACQLLAQGNHRLLEALFWPGPAAAAFETVAWRELRELAGRGLVALPALNHYLGVAQGQLQTRPLTHTHLYHALRLLSEAGHIADHHRPPRVALPPDEVAFLLRVRDAGKLGDNATAFTLAHLTERAKAQAAAIAERKGADLPRRPDVEPLDRWLSALRLLTFLE